MQHRVRSRPIRFARGPSVPVHAPELIGCLETIADPEEVRRAWIDHDEDSGLLRGGWLPNHVISQIDDLVNLGRPETMLGITLETANEVTLVSALNATIDHLYDSLPSAASDTETVTSPEWQLVAVAAANLVAELRASGG